MSVEVVEKPAPGKLYLFNAPCVFLAEDEKAATILVQRVSVEEARDLLKYYEALGYPVISAIGHEATAKVLSLLLEREITANRIEASLKRGDKVLAFRLKKRLPEGKVIESVEEIEEIGYELIFFDI
ncbi:MAG: DUF1874 domain-containing protein [Candidatus Nezhaarchaeales archaeon]